ncbi:MAG: UDPGP type 1 family protein [Planctomycetaceae bacterium]
MTAEPAELLSILRIHNQQHVLRWWNDLNEAQRSLLTTQIEDVDFETVRRVWSESSSQVAADDNQAAWRADRATAPSSVVRQPVSDSDRAAWQDAVSAGERLLADGSVAVITVAGGQGSRLGFEHPKGMFPIGPVSDRTLFQIFAEQIRARRRRHGGSIPWLIMTSAATHEETIAFFGQHNFFGLPADSVAFFMQGDMPAVDAATGRLLLKDKASLALSPDGHGGIVGALKKSGLLDRLARDEVDYVFYHQVDNPTVIICDPALIGLHHQHKSQMTTNVVRKTSPTERMGVLVDLDGRTEIIEYSELTDEQANRTDGAGQWVFWAGNTAIHIFAREFFEQLTDGRLSLPLHLALKKVPYLDDSGVVVEPEKPNANKFERFIFDALPLAEYRLIVEGDRAREFNPVKNADGSDSPATAKAALNRIGREWLAAAGYHVADDTNVEISPLVALDAAELASRLASGKVRLEDLTDGK